MLDRAEVMGYARRQGLDETLAAITAPRPEQDIAYAPFPESSPFRLLQAFLGNETLQVAAAFDQRIGGEGKQHERQRERDRG